MVEMVRSGCILPEVGGASAKGEGSKYHLRHVKIDEPVEYVAVPQAVGHIGNLSWRYKLGSC